MAFEYIQAVLIDNHVWKGQENEAYDEQNRRSSSMLIEERLWG